MSDQAELGRVVEILAALIDGAEPGTPSQTLDGWYVRNDRRELAAVLAHRVGGDACEIEIARLLLWISPSRRVALIAAGEWVRLGKHAADPEDHQIDSLAVAYLGARWLERRLRRDGTLSRRIRELGQSIAGEAVIARYE